MEESITTAMIPDELQKMLLQRCKEPTSLIGKMQDPSTVQVLAAVETKRLGCVIWAPVGFSVVGYMHPELSRGNGDQDDEFKLFITNNELCGVCHGTKVRIERLSSSPHSDSPLVAAVQLQFRSKKDTSSQEGVLIEYEPEAARLESAVYRDQNQVAQHASQQQEAAEYLTPHDPVTFDAIPSVNQYRTCEPDSDTTVPLELSLEVLFHLDGTTGDTCHDIVAPTMGTRLRTVAQQLRSWFSASKCTSKGACIAHFWVPGQALPLSAMFPVPVSTTAADERTEALHQWRHMLHTATLSSTERPLFRLGQRVRFDSQPVSTVASEPRLRDIHIHAQPSPLAAKVKSCRGRTGGVLGSYEYFHYMHEGCNDVGWGCAYRSLQTIWSWYRLQGFTDRPAPSHREIQQCLVSLGDKEPKFAGSQEWVGAIELGMVLQHELGVDYRIISVASGAEIPSKGPQIAAHFQTEGTPIMIGGGVLAYTLLGIDWLRDTGQAAFLILDPHYTGRDEVGPVVKGKWVAWKQMGQRAAAGGPLFKNDAFYNILCPSRPREV